MISSVRFCLLVVSLLLAVVSSAAFMPVASPRVTGVNSRSPQVAASAASTTRIWGGPAILERPLVVEKPAQTVTDEPTRDRKQQGSEAWEVRIYNDGLNTREHVARSLVQVTGLTEMTAYQTMMQAHQNGIAVVGRWAFEIAEMFHDELKRNGIVCDIVPVDEEQ